MKKVLFAGVSLVFVFFVALEVCTLFSLPSTGEIRKLVVSAPRYIPSFFDRNGLPLPARYTLVGQSTYIPLDSIPKHVREFCVYFEDRTFWKWYNFGVDPAALIRSAFTFGATGGSTIAMQLIKNASGYSERSLWRKWLEIHEAVVLNIGMSKSKILEVYFNTVPFGSGDRVGIGAAAEFYFSKRPGDLTPAEGLFLVTLLPLSTSDARADLDRIMLRYRARAQRLMDAGYMSSDDPHIHEFMMGPELRVHQNLPSTTGMFMDRALEELSRRMGGMPYAPELDGLQVVTTLDLPAQDSVAAILADVTNAYSHSYASFIMMNSYGEIVIYASSYPTFPQDFDIIQSEKILPASRMKVFAYSCVVDALLAKGFSEKQVLEFRLPTSYRVSERLVIHDLTGQPVQLRVALAKSINSSAYYAVNKVVTPADVVAFMHRLHGKFLPYPSIAMGTQPWSELKLCSAFNTILNRDGYYTDASFIRRISSRTGNLILLSSDNPRKREEEPVVSGRVCSLIKECLREATSNGTSKCLSGLPALASLDIGFKTGTAKSDTQLGITGYVGDYCCSLLLHGKRFRHVSGEVAAPILGRILVSLKTMDKL